MQARESTSTGESGRRSRAAPNYHDGSVLGPAVDPTPLNVPSGRAHPATHLPPPYVVRGITFSNTPLSYNSPLLCAALSRAKSLLSLYGASCTFYNHPRLHCGSWRCPTCAELKSQRARGALNRVLDRLPDARRYLLTLPTASSGLDAPPRYPLAQVMLARQWLSRRIHAVVSAEPPDLNAQADETALAQCALDRHEVAANSLAAPVRVLQARLSSVLSSMRTHDPRLQWQMSLCFTRDGRPHVHGVLLASRWLRESRWLKRLPSAQDCRQAAAYGLAHVKQYLQWIPAGVRRVRSSGAFRCGGRGKGVDARRPGA